MSHLGPRQQFVEHFAVVHIPEDHATDVIAAGVIFERDIRLLLCHYSHWCQRHRLSAVIHGYRVPVVLFGDVSGPDYR